MRSNRGRQHRTIKPFSEHFTQRVWLQLHFCSAVTCLFIRPNLNTLYTNFKLLRAIHNLLLLSPRRRKAKLRANQCAKFVHARSNSALLTTSMQESSLFKIAPSFSMAWIDFVEDSKIFGVSWRLLYLKPSCSEAKLVRCRCSMWRQFKLLINFRIMNVTIVRSPIRLCTDRAHLLYRFGALLACVLLNHLSEHLRILSIN